MKKLICLFLVFITLSLCLVGCDWENIFNPSTTTTSVLKTTVPNRLDFSNTLNTLETALTTLDTEKGETITITHGKDFTYNDIEFLLMLHGKTRNDLVEYEKIPQYRLDDVLTRAQKGNPLYLAHFENPYFISAYLKPDASEYELDEFGGYKFDVTKYVWYKFYKSAQIVDEIEGMEQTKDTYLIYDCIIREDIVNGIRYNQGCKYYMEYKGAHDLEKTASNMILYFDFTYWMTGETWFVPYPESSGSAFEVYVDDNGTEYLYFVYRSCDKDGVEQLNVVEALFGEHLDSLSQHFEILNECLNENELLLQYAGIKLDAIVEYLDNGG